MESPTPPLSREQFEVAIICAVPREADAVTLLFDTTFARNQDGEPYGQTLQDTNCYTLGRIGLHHVVLTTLPEKGVTSAAVASTMLKMSFGRLRLVLMVGTCGGVPGASSTDMFLGDVVISRSVIQYDYGKRHPGHFLVKKEAEDGLGRASREIRSLISHLQGEHNKEILCESAATYLAQLQQNAREQCRVTSYARPKLSQDILFQSSNIHKHRDGCSECFLEETAVCNKAMAASCDELGCASEQGISRNRVTDDGHASIEDYEYGPKVFIGRMGSANAVMKSAIDRDLIAKTHGLIAFEMEAAGAWEDLPCLAVKGICNYADSHKNNIWRDFSVASAACVGKAIFDFLV